MIRMKEITTADTPNCEDPTTGIGRLTGPITTKVNVKDPAKIVNAKIILQTNAKRVSIVERLHISAMSTEVTLPTI